MKFRSLFLAVLCLAPLTALGEKTVLNVVTSEYPPYGYLSEGKVIGEDTEIIRQVLSNMGYQVNIRVLPWARAEALVKSGRADMLYSLTFSAARNQHYHFTAPISAAQDVFFKHKNRDIEWQTLDDLTGLNFGLSAAYSYAPEFMDWLFDGNARITRITHEQPELTGLRMVGLGRIDLFICEKLVCEYLLDHRPSDFQELANVEQMPGNVGPKRSFHAGFSRKLANGSELRDQFNEALKEIQDADSN